MKVFISLPMNGYTDDEILERQQSIFKIVLKFYPQAELIDSFVVGADNGTPLFYLGKSLSAMAAASICIFAEDWQRARGCRIEHDCAELYGYRIVYEGELWRSYNGNVG